MYWALFYFVSNCFITCQNIAHVQTPFPFLLGLRISLETRTNSERREQILAQSCLRADQTRWSCVILSDTIVLRSSVEGTVWTIKAPFTSGIYYAIAITIRFRLCTHYVIAIIMYSIENSGNCILNQRSKWTPLCYYANVIAILILFYGVNRNRNWMHILPPHTVVRVLKP